MLNTKYIIYNEQAEPLQNRYASGPVWFVSNYKLVADADSEMIALGNFNPMRTAIIDKRFSEQLNDFNYKNDPGAKIEMKEYKANHLTYESNSSAEELAMFSEIYYDDGWNAYVDGTLSPYFRADYVLRGMRIPAGKHTIEFKFEPNTYAMGEKISYASSSAVILWLLASVWISFRKKDEEK